MQPAVSELEQQFPGRVTAHNVDATTPEAEQAVQALGFANHGLVIRSPEGKALWQQPDHEVKVDDARNALAELLK